jgi:hypothetical protein
VPPFRASEIEKFDRVLAWREIVTEDVLRNCFIALIHRYIDILGELRRTADQVLSELK